MPLKGIKVLEFVGLAPGPFCGKVLADFGARVTRIDKAFDNTLDCFQNGKETIALNIKHPKAQSIIQSLCQKHDVLIEPYRPGVMEKYNLGPDKLCKINPKLIYARLTGFGQTGPLASRAGHDINYVAISGILSFLGRKNENPTAPINLLADFAGGGLLCAFGICLALLERHKSGKGQIIDNSMVEGCAYIGSWLIESQKLPIWGNSRGENHLDTGAFYYDTYKTKDRKYMSVGALEPQFFKKFVHSIGLENLDQFDDNENAKKIVAEKFLTKTQKEWEEIFENQDACVFPVVDWQEAALHRHNKERESFDSNIEPNYHIPKPAPKLSRSPGKLANSYVTNFYESALKVLSEIGINEDEMAKLSNEGVLNVPNKSKL